MKVLQVAHYYGSPGGIERVVSQFCACLKQEYEVEVLVANEGAKTEETIEDGVRVTRVGRVAHINRMSICPTFPSWLKKKNPDLVHLHLINPLAELSYLVSNLRCKAIATYHMDITRQLWMKPIHQPMLDRVLNKLDRITVSSQRFAENSPVLSRYMDKIHILPFGISEERFKATPFNRSLTEEFKKQYAGKLVLFVGRLTHYKGLSVLVEAMKKVDATCVIIGTGYLRETIKEQIKEEGLEDRVHLIGHASDEELAAYYDRADVFVLPSINRTESFGITQLEAMSRGTPVVCTEVGTGTTTINRHEETGLVVPPQDPEMLSQAINRILSDEALAHKLSKGAVERYKTYYSEAVMWQNLRSLYSELLA
ncbi:MAG: glycosyltransferase [Candidatus Omnitrophica bacterium]|nr:glycosyltransferase [Candidatus Omnitrophota bacterium]